jgi:hypothetical protein
LVISLTNAYRKQLTKGYITGLAGKKDGWHLDHKYSILCGYRSGVSPFVIAHLSNLEMIPWQVNMSKSSKNSITLSELLALADYSLDQSNYEFEKICQFIRQDISNNTRTSNGVLLELIREAKIHKKFRL